MKTPDRRTVLRILVTVVLIAIVVPFVVYSVPGVVGADHSYVVLSGSMEPTIQTGGVAIVNEQSPSTIERGDIITFVTKGEEVPTTHRVVDVRQTEQGREFVTKGDANDARDSQPVFAQNVIGTLAFSIPYIGYVINFAGTQLGFITLVVLPIGLLVLGELYDLGVAALNTSREANETTEGDPEDDADESRTENTAPGFDADGSTAGNARSSELEAAVSPIENGAPVEGHDPRAEPTDPTISGENGGMDDA